jgi:acetyl esterase
MTGTSESHIRLGNVAPDPDVSRMLSELPQMLNELPTAGPDPNAVTLRAALAAFIRYVDSQRGQRPHVGRVIDGAVTGREAPVPVRIYEPTGDASDVLDALVFLHGGGWVVGDIEMADAGARALSAGLGIRVVSVGYRLAPECPFPAGLNDAIAVVEEVASSASSRSVMVGGESAGGNLAASVALHCRDRSGLSLAAQILINPVLDSSCTSQSHQLYGSGFGLTSQDMLRFVDWYVAPPADAADPRVSPLNSASLSGSAPALIVTAGFDPLRDDGSRYAQRLIDDQVAVTYLPMPTMVHGWWNTVGALAVADRQLKRIIEATRMCLAVAHREGNSE